MSPREFDQPAGDDLVRNPEDEEIEEYFTGFTPEFVQAVANYNNKYYPLPTPPPEGSEELLSERRSQLEQQVYDEIMLSVSTNVSNRCPTVLECYVTYGKEAALGVLEAAGNRVAAVLEQDPQYRPATISTMLRATVDANGVTLPHVFTYFFPEEPESGDAKLV